MSDDWLDTGHGPDASRLTTVFSRMPSDAGDVSTGSVRSRASRSAGPLSVGIVLAAVVVVGSAGAVFAIRESLFPSLGADTARSVWQNPVPPASTSVPRLTPVVVAATITAAPTTTTATTTPTTTPSGSVTASGNPSIASPATTPDDHRSEGFSSDADDTTTTDPERDDSGSDSDDSGSGSDGSGSGSSGSDDVDDSGSDVDEDDSGSDSSGSGSGVDSDIDPDDD